MNRVSQTSLYTKMTYDLNRLTSEMSRLNESIASGRKVNRPSDDILGGTTILRMRTALAEIDQYERDLSQAQDWLSLTDSALLSIKTSLTDAKTLAEQMSTDLYQDSNMEAAAVEISNIIDEIIQLANTDAAGRYLFSGSRTDQPPFTRELNILAPTAALSASSAYIGQATASGTYTGNQSREYLVRVTTAGGSADQYATLTTFSDQADDDLVFTAVAPEAAGENVTVEFVDPGAINQPLTVTVVGDAVTINLATDGAGAITTTAAELMAAVNADTDASALVTVSTASGNDGSGVVTAMAGPQNLSRGFSYARLSGSAAAMTTSQSGTDNDLTFSAKNMGADGDLIRIRYVDPQAAGQPLSISVDGNDITVNLATDAGGAVTTTANQVLAAINADVDAGALVSASLAGLDSGAGTVTAMDYTSLSRTAHSALDIQALTPGANGNQISISYIHPGTADTATSVNVVNAGGGTYEIQVTLGTDSSGNIIATADDVRAAIVADTANPLIPTDVAAGDLIQVSLAEGSSGSGILSSIGTYSLSGGADTAALYQVSEDGGLTWGPADEFMATTAGSAVYDSNGEDLDLGLRIAFSNQGTLSAGDTFSVRVSRYLGNTDDIEVNIQRSQRVSININGENVLGADGDPDNILDSLFRLHDALVAYDTEAVGDELEVMDSAMENLTTEMAKVGMRINRAEVAANILSSNKITKTQFLSDAEDIDLVEAINDIELIQVAYQATLASTSLITSLSLLDYIR